jgi:hypothetical protein
MMSWTALTHADGVLRCHRCKSQVPIELPICRKCNPIRSSPTGPGTELSKLLKRFGIEPTPTCKCRAKAAQMDAWGPDECSKPERIEEVVAVMREEAKARGLPFLDAAGRMLVKRAIKNARKPTLTNKAT